MHGCMHREHVSMWVPWAAHRSQKTSFRSQFSLSSVMSGGDPAEGLMNTGKCFEAWTQVVRFIQQLSTGQSSCFLITNIQALEKKPWEVPSVVPIHRTFHKVGINGTWLDSWLASPSLIVKWLWYKWVGCKNPKQSYPYVFPSVPGAKTCIDRWCSSVQGQKHSREGKVCKEKSLLNYCVKVNMSETFLTSSEGNGESILV